MSTESPGRCLRLRAVLDCTGLKRSTLYRKMEEGSSSSPGPDHHPQALHLRRGRATGMVMPLIGKMVPPPLPTRSLTMHPFARKGQVPTN